MADYVLVVYSSPVPGREDEYNDWYNNQHLKDVLAQPGYISARRYKLTNMKLADEMPDASHPYVAMYYMNTDDPQKALDDMKARVGAGIIGLSDAMAQDFLAYCYEAASPLVNEI